MATVAQVKAFIDKISVIAIDVCKSKSRKIRINRVDETQKETKKYD